MSIFVLLEFELIMYIFDVARKVAVLCMWYDVVRCGTMWYCTIMYVVSYVIQKFDTSIRSVHKKMNAFVDGIFCLIY